MLEESAAFILWREGAGDFWERTESGVDLHLVSGCCNAFFFFPSVGYQSPSSLSRGFFVVSSATCHYDILVSPHDRAPSWLQCLDIFRKLSMFCQKSCMPSWKVASTSEASGFPSVFSSFPYVGLSLALNWFFLGSSCLVPGWNSLPYFSKKREAEHEPRDWRKAEMCHKALTVLVTGLLWLAVHRGTETSYLHPRMGNVSGYPRARFLGLSLQSIIGLAILVRV